MRKLSSAVSIICGKATVENSRQDVLLGPQKHSTLGTSMLSSFFN